MKRSYSNYSANDDLVWLMLRPWIFIPRVLYILLTFIFLFLRILSQGNSKNKNVQKNLSKYLFDVITDLGPCFIKLGQALSTRPDLVRQDWLTELTYLQDNLPAFDHKIALKIIEEELGASAEKLFDEFTGRTVASAILGQVYKAKINNALGFSYAAQNEFKKAIKHYKSAIKSLPEYPIALNNLASAQQRLLEYDLAYETYQKVLVIDPKNKTAIKKSKELEKRNNYKPYKGIKDKGF